MLLQARLPVGTNHVMGRFLLSKKRPEQRGPSGQTRETEDWQFVGAVVSDHSESIRCGFFHWIEPLQLVACIARSELPGNAAPLRVAFGFHGLDLVAQSGFTC